MHGGVGVRPREGADGGVFVGVELVDGFEGVGGDAFADVARRELGMDIIMTLRNGVRCRERWR